MSLTTENIQALRKSFPIELHSVREGPTSKDKAKCMWFVYLDRHAIAERLDDLFPGEWEFMMTEPVKRDGHFSSVGRLTIKGIVREFNGAQEIGTDSWSKAWDDEKGCGTDTFRRVASMWGIGAYLNKAPDTWTAKPDRNDWDAQKAAKAEVLKRLGAWLSNARNNERPPANNGQQAKQGADVKWPSKKQVTWVMGQLGNGNEGLSQAEIFQLAGVSSFDDGDGWRAYEDAQAAVLHIQATLDAQLDNEKYSEANGGVSNVPDNTEQTATFKWMNCIGSHSNLQFSTNPPGSKHNTYGLLYGGRSAIRSWGGDELYEQLQLEQFDKIKGKNIVSDFVEMVVPVEFRFVSEGNNGEAYFKIVGIVGDPVIPY